MSVHRIALTGGSSTGKTTLAEALARDEEFKRIVPHFVPEGARDLLASIGDSALDSMTRDELRDFQRRFFEWKTKAEPVAGSYLVDRSFVDVAAVWFERDTFDQARSLQDELLVPCRVLSARYTLHILVTATGIPFENDRVRESDMTLHRRIGERIVTYLREWQLPHMTLRSSSLSGRIAEVKGAIIASTI